MTAAWTANAGETFAKLAAPKIVPATEPSAPTLPTSTSPPKRHAIGAPKPTAVVSAVAVASGACSRLA